MKLKLLAVALVVGAGVVASGQFPQIKESLSAALQGGDVSQMAAPINMPNNVINVISPRNVIFDQGRSQIINISWAEYSGTRKFETYNILLRNRLANNGKLIASKIPKGTTSYTITSGQVEDAIYGLTGVRPVPSDSYYFDIAAVSQDGAGVAVGRGHFSILPPAKKLDLNSSCPTTQFTRELGEEITGNDVVALQRFLVVKGFEPVAATWEGSLTGYFNPETKSALRRYQLFKKLSSTDGFFDSVTREAVKKDCAIDGPIGTYRLESPKSGEVYKFMDELVVKWNPANYNGSKVSVLLRRVDTPSSVPANAGAQADVVDNNGSIKLNVGIKLNPNEGPTKFYARITCPYAKYCVSSDSAIFTISPADQVTQPMIKSVTSPINAGQKMSITGTNLNGSSAFGTVYIDDKPIATNIVDGSKDGTVLFFNLPASIARGRHSIYVRTGLRGNYMNFEVGKPAIYNFTRNLYVQPSGVAPFKGPDVLALKNFLVFKGYGSSFPNGANDAFDTSAVVALTLFQRDNNLPMNGNFDNRTRGVVNNMSR